MNLLVIADFSGRGAGARGSEVPLAERLPFRVETIDDALERLRPVADLGPDPHGRLEFGALDDFHPDRIATRLPPLRALVDSLSKGIRTSDSAPDEEARSQRGSPPIRRDEPTEAPEPSSGLLDEIVAEEGASTPQAGALPDLQAWVRDTVRPHLDRQPTSGERSSLEDREAEAVAVLGAVMRDPAVRELERIWLSLLHLLRVATATPGVRVHIFDLALDELESLTTSSDPADSALRHRILDGLPAKGVASELSLVVGGYEFGPSPSDIRLLNRITMTVHLLGARFIAAASPSLLGMEAFDATLLPESSDQPTWGAFRETETAGSTALLAPGFLLRVPYGEATEPCEVLSFDELEDGGGYLWGNPAFLGAATLVEQVGRTDQRRDPGAPVELAGMPIHAAESGEVLAHPVQVLWSTESARRILARGVTPILGYRNEARILIPPIRSIDPTGGPIAPR